MPAATTGVFTRVCLNRAGSVTESVGHLAVILERLARLTAGVVNLSQNINGLPLVAAGLVDAGGVLVNGASDRLRDLNRAVVLPQMKVGQCLAVLETVEIPALGIDLGEPGCKLVHSFEIFQFGERSHERETRLVGQRVIG
jgi:hypothetical protein